MIFQRCAKVDNTEWDATNKECHCLEEGAEFHGNHCHSAEKKVSAAAKWGYGIIAAAIIRSVLISVNILVQCFLLNSVCGYRVFMLTPIVQSSDVIYEISTTTFTKETMPKQDTRGYL